MEEKKDTFSGVFKIHEKYSVENALLFDDNLG
jgi:hypothetical protein